MDQNTLLVKMAIGPWEAHIKRATKLFDEFTDEQLLLEVAPGRNRVIYLLGHLTAVDDSLFTLFGLGEKLHPELEHAFIKTPDRTVAEIPSAQELRQYFNEVHAKLNEAFAKLTTEQWFEKHTAVSDEDFAKEPHRNKLSVLLSRTAHMSYHMGQIALTNK
jgi:uncharacterized damage-inducible protein DinB